MKIKLCGLCKRMGGETILDSVETELESGKLLALVGTNGAGKTTLMKLLATLYAPTEGQILFDDEVLTRARIDLRAQLHFLSDTPCFLSDSPVNHICMAATLYDRPLEMVRNQIVDWLRQFDLLEVMEKKVTQLSRGQQYKVAFVGLLAANPKLWLLDEPFAAGVDPTGISAIKRSIDKVVGAGGTVIYSTQIVELAENFSDRIWVLHKGQMKLDMATNEMNTLDTSFGLAGIFEQLRLVK